MPSLYDYSPEDVQGVSLAAKTHSLAEKDLAVVEDVNGNKVLIPTKTIESLLFSTEHALFGFTNGLEILAYIKKEMDRLGYSLLERDLTGVIRYMREAHK